MSQNELYQSVKGGAAQLTEMKTGGPLPDGGGLPNSCEQIEVYTEKRVNSNQERALSDTLDAGRSLRDELLREDEHSQAGLLLAQLALILERIEHGVPCGKEAFLAILRAAQLPKLTPEATEVP